MRSTLAVRRVAAGALLMSILVAPIGAAASGPAPGPSWPEPATTRPHIEVPAAAPPHTVHLPTATDSHLLLSSKELQVTAPVRLLVFAPHPDDETLSAGGLIQRVLAKGGQVRVVFVTNGDGYVDGVRREVRRSRTSRADFIEYGERRYGEAQHALHDLGLHKTDGVFLGFPDDGIDDLWAGHWSNRKPYRSPYTRFDRPLYKESLSRHVEYAGTDLEREIIGILREFQPQWVLVPDPRDRHPDHCTTGVFVLDALRKLRHTGEPAFTRTQTFSYLVHYPDYPASPAWVKEIAGAGVGGSVTARRELAGIHWLNMPLTPAELARKRQAMSEYHSQIQVMNPFLEQFLRSFELFGQLDAEQVIAVPHEYAARFKRP